MSAKHPIIAVTGSSGAGTTSVTRTFNWIFRREHVNAVLVEGDSFHRYDRLEMPTVDTSNPFTARYIPAADESFVVIRFANPKAIDFPYLLSMIHDSFMSRPNIIVAPGAKMELAMQLILPPMVLKMMDGRRRAIGAQPPRFTV